MRSHPVERGTLTSFLIIAQKNVSCSEIVTSFFCLRKKERKKEKSRHKEPVLQIFYFFNKSNNIGHIVFKERKKERKKD